MPALRRHSTQQLAQLADVHLEIGNLGDTEGAAGSIYMTDAGRSFTAMHNGQPFRRPADVILRRVNDVPGSTEAQRRWHIERIEWKDAPRSCSGAASFFSSSLTGIGRVGRLFGVVAVRIVRRESAKS